MKNTIILSKGNNKGITQFIAKIGLMDKANKGVNTYMSRYIIGLKIKRQ
jgi:hypothetical protein